MISDEFIDKLKQGNKRAAAKAISLIELDNSLSDELLQLIFPFTGNAYRIGITGPPGAGKSTLTNQLTKYYRSQNKKVGIIAVDPTSPFTGGALLGDRVRMNEIGSNENVFIRSMATRGSLGGLSKKAVDAADVLDAAGYDFIIFETVGVGQSELDIAKAADTTIVVLVPESGDSVQAMKAGLMEIADFFVLNKSDRPGAEQAVVALKSMLQLRFMDNDTYLPKILKAIAAENKGIEEIAGEIKNHHQFLIEKNLFNSKRVLKMRYRIRELVEEKVRMKLWNKDNEKVLADSLQKVVVGSLSPYTLAEHILTNFKNHF